MTYVKNIHTNKIGQLEPRQPETRLLSNGQVVPVDHKVWYVRVTSDSEFGSLLSDYELKTHWVIIK